MPRPLIIDAQQALGFVTPQFYNIERTIYEIPYPEMDYGFYVPVVTEGNEWARGTLFYSTDAVGEAQWIAGNSMDMPYADVSRSQFMTGFHMAGIGYEWNLEEIRVAMQEGIPITDAKARAARRAAVEMCWNVAMIGDTRKGFTGLTNQAGVTAGDVPADGTGSVTWWANKTGEQIARDLNAALTGIHTGTREVELADTVLLPTEVLLDIGNRVYGSADNTTILSFIRTNNVYTQVSGRPLTIRGLRTLSTADPGGDGRGIAYRRDPDVIRFHEPMPHRFLPPFQKASMIWEVAGIMRLGGVEVRRPGAMRYFDGIYNAP